MYAVSQGITNPTLILQHKKWGQRLDSPVAVLPATAKRARVLCKVANMTQEERVETLADVIDPTARSMANYHRKRMSAGSMEPWFDYLPEAKNKARAILAALGFAEEGK